METANLEDFSAIVWDYYAKHGRHDLPWRLSGNDGLFDPYHIIVSEYMLQQTQVTRVIPKYQAFLQQFPSFKILAEASLSDVLTLWSGLGYNRRAKFLWLAAQKVVHDFGGQLPASHKELVSLPGIGPNTAGAILAYAFNQPALFIETNIRTVYIHHFFPGHTDISDAALLPYLTSTLSRDNPREWYWALMDYGSHLKQAVGNLSRMSATYARQSTFQGSKRQLRGHVLRLLITGPQDQAYLKEIISDERLETVLEDLTQERLIIRKGPTYQLPA